MSINKLYEETSLTIQQIADELNLSFKTVFKFIQKNYSEEVRKQRKILSYRNSKLGDKNPRFGKPGLHAKDIVSDNKGYLMTLKPQWYTGRKKSRHVFYHHVIICQALGLTAIPQGWCVHHCDFNPVNNDISNLVLIALGDHTRLHRYLKGATTISKESTLKWVEAHGTKFIRDDIVSSVLENTAAKAQEE